MISHETRCTIEKVNPCSAAIPRRNPVPNLKDSIAPCVVPQFWGQVIELDNVLRYWQPRLAGKLITCVVVFGIKITQQAFGDVAEHPVRSFRRHTGQRRENRTSLCLNFLNRKMPPQSL